MTSQSLHVKWYNVVMGPDGKTYLQAPLAQSEDLSPIQPILRLAGAATGTGCKLFFVCILMSFYSVGHEE